jgi:hypothetical protein
VEVDNLRSLASMDKNETIRGHFFYFEAIVKSSNPREQPIEQAGGLQGRGIGFHGKFIPV